MKKYVTEQYVYKLHVAIDPELGVAKALEIAEAIKNLEHVLGVGFHGTVRFDKNYPTSI